MPRLLVGSASGDKAYRGSNKFAALLKYAPTKLTAKDRVAGEHLAMIIDELNRGQPWLTPFDEGWYVGWMGRKSRCPYTRPVDVARWAEGRMVGTTERDEFEARTKVA